MNYEEVLREGSRAKAFGLGVASLFDFMGTFGPQLDDKPYLYEVKRINTEDNWQRAGEDMTRVWEQVGKHMYKAMGQVRSEHPELAEVTTDPQHR